MRAESSPDARRGAFDRLVVLAVRHRLGGTAVRHRILGRVPPPGSRAPRGERVP
ncbi:hypothetical protein [Streptomyces spinoverrucosus]|uniref:hypothetical protein n=1 Tax=Streptomyces spinoverrucosus TaxID=284043 RepID=UPI00142EA446|nr:hypothetical protein [Streptomyces spinoverrucosus]